MRSKSNKSTNSQTNANPTISCVTTVFNEGNLASKSIESLLNQSFVDFEIVIVDDGASSETRKTILSYDDARIVYVRQTNDGLSSARNRGLHHCKGNYVCFLDSDDTRPAWAFEIIANEIEKNSPDVLFTQGCLSEIRGELKGFYDTEIFQSISKLKEGKLHFKHTDSEFDSLLPLLLLIEPQSANKIIRRDLITKHMLTFPNGHFFEDMLFHTGVISSLKSVSIINDPCFTYYRRYGRPQITSGNSAQRFDSLAVAGMTLQYYAGTSRFENIESRFNLLLSMFKLVKWCGDNISHMHRYQFHQKTKYLLNSMDNGYRHALKNSGELNSWKKFTWCADVSSYLSSRL